MIINVKEHNSEYSDFVGALLTSIAPLATTGLSKIGAKKDRISADYQAQQAVKIQQAQLKKAAYESQQAEIKAKEKKQTIIIVAGISFVALVVIALIFKR